MKHNLSIDYIKEYDLVVCGGGFTGVSCAIQAAKLGLNVALVESKGSLGGVGTVANVPMLLGGIDYNEEKHQYNFIVGGLFKKMYYDLRKTDSCVNNYQINREESPHAWFGSLSNGIIFDVEKMKVLLDSYITENNIDLTYFTNVIDVKMDNNKIDYVLCANKSGIYALKGKAFADCTGDADLVKMAGGKYILGREEDNLMAPATLIMVLENVDTKAYINEIKENKSPRFKEKIKKLRAEGVWDFPYEILISAQLNRVSVHMINTVRQVGIDGTSGESLTKGMIEGRAESNLLFSILKKHFVGFENAYISKTAEMIGIRETRRIDGEYKLTLKALLEGDVFDDTICLSSYCFDLPDPKNPSLQPLHSEEFTIKNKYTQIPYKTMIPKGIDNLICPGRAICCERDVLGPIRVMGPCTGMGQAAGAACYEKIKNNISFKNANVKNIQKIVREYDGIISNDDINKVEEII